MTSPYTPPSNPPQDGPAGPPNTPQHYNPQPNNQAQSSWPQPPVSYPGQQQWGAPAASAPVATPVNRRMPAIVALVGAVVIIVGSVMPWASVMDIYTVNGTDGDGVLTIICAVLAGAFVLPALMGKGPRWMFVIPLFFGLVAAAIGGYDLANLADAVAGQDGMAKLGAGLPIVIFGGLAAVVGGVLGLIKK